MIVLKAKLLARPHWMKLLKAKLMLRPQLHVGDTVKHYKPLKM